VWKRAVTAVGAVIVDAAADGAVAAPIQPVKVDPTAGRRCNVDDVRC